MGERENEVEKPLILICTYHFARNINTYNEFFVEIEPKPVGYRFDQIDKSSLSFCDVAFFAK